MPKLAVFPKAFMRALCTEGSMRIAEWIDLGCSMDIEGLEWYAGFQEMATEANWPVFRKMVEARHKSIPMLCCSPDFTHPDPEFRKQEIIKQKKWIDMAFILGASYCRVLSGQRRPGLTIKEGLDYATQCIYVCLDYAEKKDITLVLENHYKDDFWQFPEFAQKMDVFCAMVDQIQHPNFGVNFDPSNAYLAGDDPLELLKRVVSRVVTMHASDRYLTVGTIEDLRREEVGAEGYAKRLAHGEIGKGLNDYDAIFTTLSKAGFDGWISIEDGVNGLDQMIRSVTFLKEKIKKYWPAKNQVL